MRSLFFFSTFFPVTLLCLLTAIATSLFGATPVHRIARSWARMGLWLAGSRLQIEGREHIPLDRPVIFMPNHQSNFDILALFAGLPVQFRWLAKQELFSIPLFGLAMRRSGYIPVDRSDRKKSMRSMSEAASRIAAGVSVILFPEGTRSPDGQLLPFKKGGFILALQAQVAIVPIVITGSRDIMGKHSLRIGQGTIRLTILPPVETTGKTNQDRETMMAGVREAVAATLAGRNSAAGAPGCPP